MSRKLLDLVDRIPVNFRGPKELRLVKVSNEALFSMTPISENIMYYLE